MIGVKVNNSGDMCRMRRFGYPQFPGLTSTIVDEFQL